MNDRRKLDFSGKRIIVIGDAVADQFLQGTISRISREAPVFILRHEQTATVPGAAANAAANVASLGGSAAMLGVVGKDANGSALKTALQERDIDIQGLVAVDELITTTKVRVLAGHHYAPRQQVIRI